MSLVLYVRPTPKQTKPTPPYPPVCERTVELGH